MKFEGPYKVLKKVSSDDYVVSLPGKRKNEKVLHANMLKKYVVRKDYVSTVVSGVEVDNEESLQDEIDFTCCTK